jgi:biopolymer transport protein ExbD
VPLFVLIYFLWKIFESVSHKQTMLMSQMNLSQTENLVSSRKRVGVQRMVKHNLKVDMTPMVDLGFLLITFFVITTELSKPTVMDLYMPKDGPPTDLGESNALSFLLGKNNTVYYYNGKWEDAKKKNEIFATRYSSKDGLRKIINEKQHRLDATISKNKEGRDGLMLLIKPGKETSYKNVIDVLDEATINVVKKYAVIKLSDEEADFLKSKEQ